MSLQDECYPDFYIYPDGTEVEIQDLICPSCGKKADEMDEEADTVLWCPCGERFYHVIWET